MTPAWQPPCYLNRDTLFYKQATVKTHVSARWQRGDNRPMYVPAHFKPDDAAVLALLGSGRAANLITATSQGLLATMLPLVHDTAKRARTSDHGAPSSDTWHGTTPSGRRPRSARRWSSSPVRTPTSRRRGTPRSASTAVVPTWNYITAHVYGRWSSTMILPGSRQCPAPGRTPRAAPGRAVVGRRRPRAATSRASSGQSSGSKILISRVDAKFKLSQNRSEDDIAGMIDGLDATASATSAAAMRDLGRGG